MESHRKRLFIKGKQGVNVPELSLYFLKEADSLVRREKEEYCWLCLTAISSLSDPQSLSTVTPFLSQL